MTGIQQPLHSRLDLASSPSAIRWGRAHARDVLGRWGVAEAAADDAVVVVSELLSNAVEHAVPEREVVGAYEDARCSLLLWLTGNGLTVAVHDWDVRVPLPRPDSPDAEHGRGLTVVQALSEAWGYTHPSPAPGKLVWARLAPRRTQEAPAGQRSLEPATRHAPTSPGVVMSP
ncbi:ATP-binding protein [Actinacidiphila acididurans]|uniref:ATP-binding protein n=1 Tax=Actinacidiphila acididurans TaxID=2784346 RepID=A0ABS2TXK3_9ACTN|nr:ATP-binding protein [Actinacidiphila acididurans]MBM9508075.1 ATP-binding protein [Actinacidiphila acididurans]